MNRDQFAGQWKQIKGEAQRMWGRLTNDDLDQVEGNATKLIGRLQERYGYAKEEAEASAKFAADSPYAEIETIREGVYWETDQPDGRSSQGRIFFNDEIE